MGNSVYTLPEVPTIGFVSGRMSSSIGVRIIITTMGLILKVSYAGIHEFHPHPETRTNDSGEPL